MIFLPKKLNTLILLFLIEIEDLPDKINSYIMTNISFFKNASDAVRSNAVLFVGHLLGNYPKENQKILSKEYITNGIIII
jgi:hypothetical protein